MRGPRKFCPRGPNNFDKVFFFVFLVNEKRDGISLACRGWPNIECWLDSFVIVRGIRASIAFLLRNPIFW